MDPAAASIASGLAAMLGDEAASRIEVRTGVQWRLGGLDGDAARDVAGRLLANPVVHAIHDRPYRPESFPTGHEHPFEVRSIPILDLDDAGLERMSREAHLFLSLDEMRAIQSHYRALGREPREIELESLAQTWSEHCVHKTLKATIDYRELAVKQDCFFSPRMGDLVYDLLQDVFKCQFWRKQFEQRHNLERDTLLNAYFEFVLQNR